MNEHGLKRKVDAWLRGQPDVWYFKVHGDRYQRAGVPDYVLCVRGVFVAVELKQDGEDATPLQARELAWVRRAGGFAGVARTLETVQSIVQRIRNITPVGGMCDPAMPIGDPPIRQSELPLKARRRRQG